MAQKDDFFIDSKNDKRRRAITQIKKKQDAQAERDDMAPDGVDEMNLENSGNEHDSNDSEAEAERRETGAQKRLRLAKQYLAKVEEQYVGDEGEIDAAEIDRDIIAERLQTDAATGRMYHRIADKYTDLIVDAASIHTLKGGKNDHQLSVTCLAIAFPSAKLLSQHSIPSSPTPIYIFTASKDASIIKWDFWTKKRMHTISGGLKLTKRIKQTVGLKNLKSHVGHTDAILTMDVSSDGKYLVTGGRDKIIHVWSVMDMSHIGSFKQHRDAISSLVFRKGQNQLYSASFDRSIKVWNVDELAYTETLFGHQDQITCIDALTKERCISSGSRDRSIRMWKIPEESQLIFRGAINSIDTSFNDDDAQSESKKEKASSGGSIDVVALVDEDTFVSGGDNGSISLWNAAKKKPLYTKMRAHGQESDAITVCRWITALAVVPFTDLFCSGSGDGVIKMWSINESKKSFQLLISIPMIGIINQLKFVQATEHEETKDVLGAPMTVTSAITTRARDIAQDKKDLYLVVAIGQEHKLGRWYKQKLCKNSTKLIKLSV